MHQKLSTARMREEYANKSSESERAMIDRVVEHVLLFPDIPDRI